MRPRLTIARRITLAILLGLLASVALVVVFTSVYWRFADRRVSADKATMFPVSAALAETASDPGLRDRLVATLAHQLPGDDLAVFTEAGALLATTMPVPFAPLARPPKEWGTLSQETHGGRTVSVLSGVTSAGVRFYALHGERDEPTPPAVAFWFWLSCVIPIVCALIAALWLARSFTRPLARIVETSRALANGQLSARVGLDRRDELGELASTLDQMASRISALQRARTELLALVSHELRTPLARIRVALDIASEGDASPARSPLLDVGTDLGELERLLGDTLAYVRLELVDHGGAGTPLTLEEVDPGSLLSEAAARFERTWPGRGPRLELGPDLPLLEADRVLLTRVLMNLLDNAAKYSPAGQTILLRATGVGEVLVVEVTDRGAGFSDLELARVFEPFFRAQGPGPATSGGLGLGLTLCRRVVEAHRGTISAHSAPGEGTTLRVVLPSGRDPPAGPAPRAAIAAAIEGPCNDVPRGGGGRAAPGDRLRPR